MNKVVEELDNRWEAACKLKNKPVVIYGMSKRAIYTFGNLSYYGFEIVAFTDSKQEESTDRKFCGKPIWSLKELKEKTSAVNVVIATYNHRFKREICRELIELGINSENIFVFGNLLNDEREEAEKILSQNAEKVQRVYDNLVDEESRIIYKEILQYRITEELKLTKDAFSRSIAKGCQYFDCDIVKLTADEVFVDGGAYVGDTIDSFANYSEGKFSHVYAFEANTANCELLSEMCSVLKISDKVDIMPYAMLNEEKEVFFCVSVEDAGSGYGKVVENSGGKLVQAMPLDSLLGDSRITYIKMDIEGAELSALRGAKHIIESQRPKLAICIYHSVNDIYEIPLYLMEICKDYKFYVRHYSSYGTESVFYAIPNEVSEN